MSLPLQPSSARRLSRIFLGVTALTALVVVTLLLALLVRVGGIDATGGDMRLAVVEPVDSAAESPTPSAPEATAAAEPEPGPVEPSVTVTVDAEQGIDRQRLQALADRLREQYKPHQSKAAVDRDAMVSRHSPRRPAASPRYDGSTRYYNGRPIRKVGVIRMLVTAYSPDARSCGKWADGITASGKPVTFNGGRLVAADTRLLPFGSLVSVPGYAGGQPVPVLDRGGKIKGHRLDVLYSTHERAMQWGRQTLTVTIWDYAD